MPSSDRLSLPSRPLDSKGFLPRVLMKKYRCVFGDSRGCPCSLKQRARTFPVRAWLEQVFRKRISAGHRRRPRPSPPPPPPPHHPAAPATTAATASSTPPTAAATTATIS